MYETKAHDTVVILLPTVGFGRKEVVECLIENGAKVDVQDDGETQLQPIYPTVFLAVPQSPNSIVLLQSMHIHI